MTAHSSADADHNVWKKVSKCVPLSPVQPKQSLTIITTIIIVLALVLLLSLPPPISSAQAIVIDSLHCSLKEQRIEATVLVDTVLY